MFTAEMERLVLSGTWMKGNWVEALDVTGQT